MSPNIKATARISIFQEKNFVFLFLPSQKLSTVSQHRRRKPKRGSQWVQTSRWQQEIPYFPRKKISTSCFDLHKIHQLWVSIGEENQSDGQMSCKRRHERKSMHPPFLFRRKITRRKNWEHLMLMIVTKWWPDVLHKTTRKKVKASSISFSSKIRDR